MRKMLSPVVMALLIAMMSSLAFANTLNGVYQFESRAKSGKADMQNWWGMMVIDNNTMTRVYRSPDGSVQKYYIGDLKQNGDLFTTTFKYAYKPNYVGNSHDNKITVSGQKLTMSSPDGASFKEVWVKK